MIVSHRGNLTGPDIKYENTIGQVMYALSFGFFVEIDVWKLEGEDFFRMGHDKPRLGEAIPLNFLEDEKLFCHCKNEEAYQFLKNNDKVKAFQHEDEPLVHIKNFKWLHSSNNSKPDNSIKVILGEINEIESLKCYTGICTDYPLRLRELGFNE